MATSNPTNVPHRALPYTLDRYVLFDWVGRGGMADIYLARMTSDFGASRLVVIKEILPHLRDDEHFADMLVQEAKLAAQLSHANIITVEDLGRHEGTLYIAMEYLEGIDLRDVLRQCSKRKIRLPLGYSLTMMCEVLRGLDYAHRFTGKDGQSKGIVHRDVSPSNVLLSFDGEVKLCDFGIASVVTEDGCDAETIEGKAGYMSPEQARGEVIDTRSDLFSAGIMLWELLNGRRLYRSRDGKALIDVAREASIPPLNKKGIEQEARLHQIVMKALSVEVGERYESAAEMHSELEAYCVQTKALVTPMRLGRWLSEHFDDDRIRRRRARERALQALERGPLVVIEPIEKEKEARAEATESEDEAPASRAPASSRPPSEATVEHVTQESRREASRVALVTLLVGIAVLGALRVLGLF